jgi:hypothetical protein
MKQSSNIRFSFIGNLDSQSWFLYHHPKLSTSLGHGQSVWEDVTIFYGLNSKFPRVLEWFKDLAGMIPD